MFMNISAEAHCWVVTGISYSLFHLVTVIYDLLNEDVMRPNQLFLLRCALSTPFTHLQIFMILDTRYYTRYLPENWSSIQFCFVVYFRASTQYSPKLHGF